MGSKLHSLKWENHSCIVMNRLANLYRRDLLIDCTIYVEGEIIHAHRNLMAAASPYFERLLMAEPNKNCFDITDLKHKDVKAVFDFMYFGSVKLPRDDVLSFIRAAEKFQINISCEGIWSFYEKDAFTQPVPLENSKQTDSLSDDWRSLTGSNKIKQEPLDCVNSEVLPYVTGYVNESMMASAGTDELRGLTESSTCSSDEWIVDSRGALVLPTHEKSPSNVHKGHVSPSRTSVPDPPREGLRSRRNRVEEKNVIPDTRQKSPESPGTKLLETSRRKSAPFSPRKRLISPSENLESASLRDMMSNNKERENSQNLISPCGETSRVNRRSISRPSMVERGKSQPECSPTVCLSESGSRDRNSVSNASIVKIETRRECENTESNDRSASSAKPLKNSSSNSNSKQVKTENKSKKKVKHSKRTVAKSKRKRREESSSCDKEANAACVGKKKGRHLKCKYCGEEFSVFGKFVSHVRCHRGEPTFTCSVCNKKFDTWASYREHTKVCLFQCEICKKILTRRYNLKDHMNIHSNERPYKCKICGKAFNSTATLNLHIRAHNNVKPYACDVCGKMFGVRSKFNLHMLTHSDTRPFVCDICGNGYNYKTTLKRHMFTHTGEKQFQCEVCKRSFATKVTLQRHVYCHMAGSTKPYTCEVCNRHFAKTSYLRSHLLIHSGERPHVCKICGKSFRLAHHLKRHGSSHNSK